MSSSIDSEKIHRRRLHSNYYWTSSSEAEVDFLISDGMEIFPMECKAGLTMNAKSLKVYRHKYMPRLSFRTSMLPYSRNDEDGIVNIPLYLLFTLQKELTF